MKRDPIAASDLPAACRTWDSKRRVWVPKVRYASDREAAAALGNDRRMTAYRCKASQVGTHFHVGHSR